jgi:tetratricopeptide (TPR) repeat protein
LFVVTLWPSAALLQEKLTEPILIARQLIKEYRYNDAINKLEQFLEANPNDPEALMLMGAAYIYQGGNFLKAKELFEQSFRAGGGAAFWVNHSHEWLSSEELTDYCRGWLYIRKGQVEFSPEDGEHAFRLAPSEIKEFEQNRRQRSMFHIKRHDRNYNFLPRSRKEAEVLLILTIYKKYGGGL